MPTINDAMQAFLTKYGYTGTLSDAELAYWLNAAASLTVVNSATQPMRLVGYGTVLPVSGNQAGDVYFKTG